MLFEVVCGYVPFGTDESDIYKIYESIQNSELVYPDDVDDEEIKLLISKLLNKAPESRVKGDIAELMADKYFDDFNWQALVHEELEPPYKPIIVSSPEKGGKFDSLKGFEAADKDTYNIYDDIRVRTILNNF